MKATEIQKEIRRLSNLIYRSQETLNELYPSGIAALLNKFGINEGDIYLFDKRKAKNRGLDEDSYGLAYHNYKKGCEILYYWRTGDPVFDVNCRPSDIMSSEKLRMLYYYLDTESRIPKGKRIVKKTVPGSNGEIITVDQSAL